MEEGSPLQNFSYLATLFGVCIAFYFSVRELKKRKENLTVQAWTEFSRKTRHYRKKLYKAMYENPTDIDVLIKEKVDTSVKSEFDFIYDYLDYIEFFSLCVNRGIYDFKMVYLSNRSYIIRLYNSLIKIIEAEEKRNEDVYREFKTLVKKLKKTN